VFEKIPLAEVSTVSPTRPTGTAVTGTPEAAANATDDTDAADDDEGEAAVVMNEPEMLPPATNSAVVTARDERTRRMVLNLESSDVESLHVSI
jgi:hypothetical protein